MNFEALENLPTIEDVDSQENPLAIAHFSNGKWDWYVLGGRKLEDDSPYENYYLFGLVNGIEKELGFFTLKEILNHGAMLDFDFAPIGVFDIYPDFDLRR